MSMYRTFKRIARNLGFRGWSFLIENDDRMYLSKFDPEEKRNEDEYRIYFFLTEEGVQIVRRFVIKSSKYKENIDLDNTYYKEAEIILNTYFKKHYSMKAS